ncbi:hypothetical protein DQ04_01191010 [Trypanosoma grayi]|uniref:hypothetical protein n=1 Tax=Trypanosoma grayi TaxID=71804 RepID=UPI0004F4A2B1|nr:hypothetical protein DQ04_01191010 [Trypanosoma grayi]KEG13133.1 hypothetical protein DQ04_01191010 [Trypanosoma grayi]
MQSFACISQVRPGFYHLTVHAKPGARSSSLACRPAAADEALEVRVAAPPVEGKANAELIDFMQTLLEQQLRMAHLSTPPCVGADVDADAYGGYAKKDKKKPDKRRKEDAKTTRGGVDYPDKVRVSLVRGATARNKVLEVAFPGTEEDLIGLLLSADAS